MPSLKQLETIRKTWLQGDFEGAESFIKEINSSDPRIIFENMLLTLFQGKHIRFNQLSLKIRSKLDTPVRQIIHEILIIHKLMVKGTYNLQYRDAMEKVTRQLSEIDDPSIDFWEGIFWLLVGGYHTVKSQDPMKAIEAWNKALAVHERMDNTYSSNYIYVAGHNNLGEVLNMTGEFHKAIDHLSRAKDRAIAINLHIALPEIYSQLGTVYSELHEYDKAIQHYKEGIKIPYLGNIMQYKAVYLYRIFRLYRKIGEDEEMRVIFDEIRELDDQEDDLILNHTRQLIEAELLLLQNRRIATAQAQRIIEKLAKDDNLYYEFVPLVKLQNVNLLIQELTMYENTDIVKDIEQMIDEISELASKWRSERLNIETIIIHAKLQLALNNVEFAYALFSRALTQADRIKNTKAAEQIGHELDKLEEEVDKWTQLSSNSVYEGVYETKVHNYIDTVVERLGNP